MTTFGDYASFYNLMYRDKVYKEEVEFVISEIRACSDSTSRILDLGCGTGMHALRFAETGCLVCGVDVSPGMLDFARVNLEKADAQVAQNVRFELSDIRNVKVPGDFDAVVSLFHVISYQTRDEDLSAVIATARRHLLPGGPFLFDFWHGPAVMKSNPMARRRQVEDENVRVVRVTTPTWKIEQNRVDVAYHFTVYDKMTGQQREFDEVHAMRYFFPSELERALRDGGFRVLKCAEWLTGRNATDDTFNAYVVAVAI